MYNLLTIVLAIAITPSPALVYLLPVFLHIVNGVSSSQISTPKSTKSSTPSPTSPRTIPSFKVRRYITSMCLHITYSTVDHIQTWTETENYEDKLSQVGDHLYVFIDYCRLSHLGLLEAHIRTGKRQDKDIDKIWIKLNVPRGVFFWANTVQFTFGILANKLCVCPWGKRHCLHPCLQAFSLLSLLLFLDYRHLSISGIAGMCILTPVCLCVCARCKQNGGPSIKTLVHSATSGQKLHRLPLRFYGRSSVIICPPKNVKPLLDKSAGLPPQRPQTYKLRRCFKVGNKA